MTALQEIKKEEKQSQLLYNYLKEKGYIIYEAITGSQAHGTSTPKSDIDRTFVYILPEEDILGIKYREHIRLNADYVGYEIRMFLELVKKNNPTILELLFGPEDCIEICHPAFKKLIDRRDEFISKVCCDSFSGYAKQQIHKAKGMDKMQNWEKTRDMTRKTPMDFCYWIAGNKSYPLQDFLDLNGLDQKFCGLVKIPNARDLWALYYDEDAAHCFSDLYSEEDREQSKEFLKSRGLPMGKGYKGIVTEEGNQLRSSSVSKEDADNELCIFSYNENGYTSHCKDYAKFVKWLKERNTDRWVETKKHGQQIDGKNMMHCRRLIEIATEIADGKGINIRRPNAQELLKIRRGEVELEELLERAKSDLEELKIKFNNSDLPDAVDSELVHEMLVDIRKTFYGKNK
jgi:hypothetical protein